MKKKSYMSPCIQWVTIDVEGILLQGSQEVRVDNTAVDCLEGGVNRNDFGSIWD